MAITYSLAPNPHWVIIDDFSKLPAGAVIYTFSHLNPSVFKPAFQDAQGNFPYSQPIMGFGNGTFPPIFWAFDSSNPNDTYYIEVWSGLKGVNGSVLIWPFDGLTGSGAGGGGGGGTTALDVQNFVINGEFYRNCGNLPIAPATSVPTFVTIAPSNNAGFVSDPTNVNGPASPDIIFAKSNTSATDSLTFNDFNPIGLNDLPLNQPTPQQFVNYTCTSTTSNETYKYIQFPLIKGLQNTSNITFSFQIYSNYISGNTNIQLFLRQFFGSGPSASPDVKTFVGTLDTSVPGQWTLNKFTSIIVPSIAGQVLSNCSNDALYLQIVFPATVQINMSFILPAMYIGPTVSTVDFHTLDFVDAIVNSPRTGDIRTSLNSFLLGWVNMNDGTIGDASSSATSRKNKDTFALFDLIWNVFNSNQTLAPMFTSGGTPTAYGVNSFTDFLNHNQIALTKNAGRVMAGALPVAASQTFTRSGNTLVVASSAGFYTGMAVTVNVSGGNLNAGTVYYAIVASLTTLSLATTTANALVGTVIPLGAVPNGIITSVNIETIGSFIGEEAHLQATNEVGIHAHGFSVPFSNQSASRGGGNADTVTNQTPFTSTTNNNIAQNVPFNIIQPTVYMNVFIKL